MTKPKLSKKALLKAAADHHVPQQFVLNAALKGSATFLVAEGGTFWGKPADPGIHVGAEAFYQLTTPIHKRAYNSAKAVLTSELDTEV